MHEIFGDRWVAVALGLYQVVSSYVISQNIQGCLLRLCSWVRPRKRTRGLLGLRPRAFTHRTLRTPREAGSGALGLK